MTYLVAVMMIAQFDMSLWWFVPMIPLALLDMARNHQKVVRDNHVQYIMRKVACLR